MQANLQTLGKTSFITCVLFSYVKLPRNANDVFLKDNFATDPFLRASTCEESARLSLSSQTGSFKHFRKVIGNYFWQLQSPRLVQDLAKDELLQMNSAAPFFLLRSPSFVSRKSQEAMHLMWESESWRWATFSAQCCNESPPSIGTPGSLKASV